MMESFVTTQSFLKMSQLKLFDIEPLTLKKKKKFYPLNFKPEFYEKVTDTLIPNVCVVVDKTYGRHYLLLRDLGNNNFEVIRKFK